MLYTFEELADLITDRQPRVGRTRLICVDGTAGSGKTTFATRLAQTLSAPLIRMDDLYEGWSGAFSPDLVGRMTSWIIEPLRAGSHIGYPRYDWFVGRYDEWVELPASDHLIIEGVRSADRGIREHAALVVWVESAEHLRLDRVLARDGEGIRAEMVEFQRDQNLHFMNQQTRAAADLIVRGDPHPPHADTEFLGVWSRADEPEPT